MIISSQILPTGFYIEGFHNERYTISIRLLYEIDKDFTLRRTNKLYYKIDEDPSFYQTHVFSLYFSASVIFPDKTY
ncbi:hypothetical protein, partial [Caldisericum sp.]|uniref:hypothetical protein n=1 Tax=Caldisericum sp. TaxID=2499687 RepID=UPI003D13C74B